jgi:hypothetical protein
MSQDLVYQVLAYAGIRVTVRHWRVAKEDLPTRRRMIPTYYATPALRERGWHPHERGGLTVVRFMANRDQFGIPKGELLTSGTARCSMDDNFDRKVGRRLALERAVRKLAFPTQVLDCIGSDPTGAAPPNFSTPFDVATE